MWRFLHQRRSVGTPCQWRHVFYTKGGRLQPPVRDVRHWVFMVFKVPGWFSWFKVGFMVFHDSRLVFHGSRCGFMVFTVFRTVFPYSRLVIHYSRIVFQDSRFFYGFSWLQLGFYLSWWPKDVLNTPKGTCLICILAPRSCLLGLLWTCKTNDQSAEDRPIYSPSGTTMLWWSCPFKYWKDSALSIFRK